jgi:hypothetical protein
MSSAILYLAIIAIWAGVLIPRWLRRDSARGDCERDTSNPPADQAGAGDGPGMGAPLADEPASPGDIRATVPDAAAATIPDRIGATVPDPGLESDDAGDLEAVDPSLGPPAPDVGVESRRRVLAARRRLLWMILALEAAADLLAASGLAAWWVIAPPTVMLAGYLLLLREAAQADAERDTRERDVAQARQPREASRPEAAEYPPAAPMAPAVFAAAPVPEDYEDLGRGRDYTPGGRPAAWDDDDSATDDDYDQYHTEHLRAVGD